jgi:hypothetical protein
MAKVWHHLASETEGIAHAQCHQACSFVCTSAICDFEDTVDLGIAQAYPVTSFDPYIRQSSVCLPGIVNMWVELPSVNNRAEAACWAPYRLLY